MKKMKTKTKKGLYTSAVLAAMLVTPVLIGEGFQNEAEASNGFAGGTGTAADPYQIATAEQLKLAHNKNYSSFILTADIDLKNQAWTPLSIYLGTFDGNGHKISNLKVNSTAGNAGLFEYIAKVTVKDLIIENATITGKGKNIGVLAGYMENEESLVSNVRIQGKVSINVSNANQVGGVVGYMSGGTMEEVFIEGNVTASGTVNDIGGVVGGTYNYGTKPAMNKIASFVNVSAPNATYVGGIAGLLYGNVSNVQQAGDVKGYEEVGGIAGRINSAKIYQAFSYGTVTGTYKYAEIGGIIGWGSGASAEQVYAYNKALTVPSTSSYAGLVMSDYVASIKNGVALSGILDADNSYGVTHTMLIENIKNKATYESYGFKFGDDWTMIDGETTPTLTFSGMTGDYVSGKWVFKNMYIDAAPKAVELAEQTKLSSDVEAAQVLVDKLNAGDLKTELNARLNAVRVEIVVKEATQAVVKAEGSKAQADIDNARTLVNALPNGADKTALTARLDAIQVEIDKAEAEKQKALEEATQAVVKAESSKTQADVDTARTLVNALPDSADKTALTERLDAVQKDIDYTAKIAVATQAVEKAEDTFTKGDYTQAQLEKDVAVGLVRALGNTKLSMELNGRLNLLQQNIDKALAEQEAIATATQAVVKAEGTKTQADVDDARTLVNNLPDGTDKTALTARLDAVQAEINTQKAITNVTSAVEKAEGSKAQTDVDEARTLVNELPDGAEKIALTVRLDAVQAEIDNTKEQQQALEKVTEAVVKAETSKSQEDVDNARTLVNELPEGADKTALTDRLDATQKAINDAKGEAEKQKAIEEATKAVVKAEGTKTQVDVDTARTLVNELPEGADKTALTERLDAIQKAVNDAKAEAEKQQAIEQATQSVVKAEGSQAQTDVDDARALVNALPEGDDKTALTERLDVVQKAIVDAKAEAEKQKAIEEATKAVVKAEGSQAQADVDDARTIVTGLPNGVDKTALNERLDVVQIAINNAKAAEKEAAKKQQALEDATQAVVKAETTKTLADLDDARTLVNALPDGTDKTALNERLDAVQKAIKEVQEANKEILAIALATQAVEKAEKDRDSRSIFSAKLTVAQLQDGEVKDALNQRIKAVEDANEYERLVKNATKAVERAEVSKTAKDIASARTQVNNLPDGDVKTELTKRIDAIEQYDPAYESAKKLVELMEKVPNEKNINNAQNVVNKVVNEAKKAELQARIDAVKAELNKDALDTATKLVVEAENTKTSISVINAQKAIDGLIPSAEKTALQERLDVVKAEIQKMNEDLSTFVVDEEVLKAIDDIENKQDREALKKWKESVERGEKYFSVNMVRSIEKSIPSAEIVNNPEYALIVHQLKARYESLLLGGKEYSYVYQMMIRDAYDAVLQFEAKPSQNLKDTALKAIEAVNNAGNADNVFITVLKARVLNVQF